ncbi:unnamed protein product [Cuscuta europaea]|uniref:Reverse transcriptase/retrotransposon-derived protein RNase H-like domain-containing protein n=1 Tax=Cuscuta europaea TaxID=41803 RepID=A0A9P0ZI54_CUSEU|nr:unnamed protein product [Cuscuta europaea]
MKADVEDNEDRQVWVRECKAEFPPLFKSSNGLPPKRDCDHAINIMEGSTIPNIRPYLGHIISKGVAADHSKIADMLDWKYPIDAKGLRGFLDLTGYYRKFVKNYSRIASPLTDLLKKDGFKWNSEAHEAFDELKQRMTQLPVLKVPDFNQTFVIESDASGKGLGLNLCRREDP